MHYRCIACSQHINTEIHRKAHTCGEKHFNICKDFFDERHQCYIKLVVHHSSTRQSDKSESDSRTRKMSFIFFDFECTQEDMGQCEEGYKKSDENGIKCMNCRKCRKSPTGSMVVFGMVARNVSQYDFELNTIPPR